MSNTKFTVDAVPTPTLNLAQAFESDLEYYVKNGNKLPPLGRSALRRVEEQLNTYLKFINESFILKGFTGSSSDDVSSPFRTFTATQSVPDLWGDSYGSVTLCNFQIQHGDQAHISLFVSITGDGMSATSIPALLTVTIHENESAVASFQQYVDGYFTMGIPFLLAKRDAAVTHLQVIASVTGGEVYVDKNGSFAQAILMQG